MNNLLTHLQESYRRQDYRKFIAIYQQEKDKISFSADRYEIEAMLVDCFSKVSKPQEAIKIGKSCIESAIIDMNTVEFPPSLTDSTKKALSQMAFVVGNLIEENRVSFYSVAVRLNPHNLDAWNSLMSLPLMTESERFRFVNEFGWDEDGALEKVKSIVQKWLGFSPDETPAPIPSIPNMVQIQQYLRWFLVQGMSDRRMDLMNQIIKNDLAFYDIEIAPIVASCLYMQNDRINLFKMANHALLNFSDSLDSFFVAGIYYLSINKYDVARKFFAKAASTSCHGWIGYGIAFSMSDESGHAINAYRTATRLYPKCILPWIYIGMEYIRTNELKLAQSYLVSALGLCEDPVYNGLYKGIVLNEIGVICLKAEQYDISMENLRMCVGSQSPYLSIFYSNLGYSLIKLRDIEAASRAFETAVDLNKQSGNGLTGLAFCHHCRGNLSRAIETYNRALSFMKGNRKVENLLTNLIQIAVNEYSFSVKLNITSSIDEEDSDMLISAF